MLALEAKMGSAELVTSKIQQANNNQLVLKTLAFLKNIVRNYL